MSGAEILSYLLSCVAAAGLGAIAGLAFGAIAKRILFGKPRRRRR